MSIESPNNSDSAATGRRSRTYLWIVSAMVPIAAGLLVYSQTAAFASDEGFHLLAAQLIAAGKRPYLDFFFAQTPLNAFWNAAWFRLFGDTWRTAHVMAALMAIAAIFLTADYVFVRFPVGRWRLPAALSTTVVFGLNIVVVQFGTLGQAYGLCLFLIVAAFRLTVASVDRHHWTLPALAGVLAGAALQSSLLTAPVAGVLLVWMLYENRAGSRWAKSAAFASGVLTASLPLFWLFAKSPGQVRFNVFDFHFFYRRVQWSKAIPHDLGVMFAWLDSSQALLLGLLALAGLVFVRFQSDWDHSRRAEFYLCAWLPLALAVHIGRAHPTFERYFILTVPFLGILASSGLYAVASKLYTPDRPWAPVLLLATLFSLGLAKTLYDGRDDRKWQEYETIARRLDQVTPARALLYADEPFYFLTRRTPPLGMEYADTHKLELPASKANALHIVPGSEIKRRIHAGVYNTVQSCDDEDYMKKLGLPGVYKHREDIDECTIFWR
jgi:hypothetical protein